MTSLTRMALMAGAAAAALADQHPSIWDSPGPSDLPPHRRGKFKTNARKAAKRAGKKGK